MLGAVRGARRVSAGGFVGAGEGVHRGIAEQIRDLRHGSLQQQLICRIHADRGKKGFERLPHFLRKQV